MANGERNFFIFVILIIIVAVVGLNTSFDFGSVSPFNIVDSYIPWETWDDGQLNLVCTGFNDANDQCKEEFLVKDCVTSSTGSVTCQCNTACSCENDNLLIEHLKFKPKVVNGNLVIGSEPYNRGGSNFCSPNPTITLKRDIIGDNIRVFLNPEASHDYLIDGNRIQNNLPNQYSKIEIISDIDMRNLLSVLHAGMPKGQVTATDGELVLELPTGGLFNGRTPLLKTTYIDYIKLKPEFSSEFDADEILIQDMMTGTLTIHDLAYDIRDIQRIFDERPLARRFISDGAVKFDTLGTTLDRFLSGNPISAELETEAYIFSYAVKKTAVPKREVCDAESAWYPVTQSCIQVVQDEEIFPEDEFVTIVPITLSNTQFKFSHTDTTAGVFFIGDDPKIRVASERPNFVCGQSFISSGFVSPSENPSCYEVELEFDGTFYQIKSLEEIEVAEGIKVKYIMGGRGVFFGESGGDTFNGGFVNEKHWSNLFVFTFSKDLLSIDTLPIDRYYIHNSDSKIKIKITNNINDFDAERAGFFIQKRKKLTDQNFDIETVNVPLFLGENEYEIELDTTTFGEIEYQVRPFIIINADDKFTFTGDSLAYFQVEIVDEVEEQEVIIPEERPATPITEDEGETQGEPEQQSNIPIIAGIAFAFLLIIWLIRKK